jgi:outer membrane receptor for ferrienterochelin and colicins
MKKIILLFTVLLLCFSSFSQKELKEVKVVKKQKGIVKSLSITGNTSVVTGKELLKAACCNLAESFETNPSIDVSFSDALTGTKQIKMLGLTSPYLLITEENIPSVRGASQAYGLSFTPGTWIESIQITKGAGSVINGYESISGQINTELIKPIKDIPFFLNMYGASDARLEINAHLNKKISDKWTSSLFVHGNNRLVKNDMNKDGFLDNPLGSQINVLNRWQYTDAEKGWVSFLNFRYMNDKKQTGQSDFDPTKDKFTTNHWGSEINTQRFDFSSKLGYVWPSMPFQSIGFQNAFNSHDQESYFGLRQYNIKQNSFYSNLIFNSIINNTMHKFTTGLNFTSDVYLEFVNTNDYSRKDNSLGTFFEYTYDNTDDFSIILGGRVDYHNRLGIFVTPRLHARYNPWKDGVIRFSAGRGKRLANIFAENQQLFGSSRSFNIQNSSPSGRLGGVYGLNPEIAWNYGFGLLQKFKIFDKNADFSVDFYRTDFQNQVVVDLFQSAQQVDFYNLKGKSFANSLQLEFNLEIIKHLNLRTSYKFYDNKTDYNSGTFQRPLQAQQRFFGNLEFETLKKEKGQQWKLDYTFNWIGQQQLPTKPVGHVHDPSTNATGLADFSKAYTLMNAQITRTFSSTFEMYLGGENIGNYSQHDAILGADDPFGSNFDTSVLYAPVFGQMYYAGLRFKVK